jgi:hypothetical protein
MRPRRASLVQRGIILVPSCVFTDRSLSCAESLVEYLWIEHHLQPSEIGHHLGMDRRNVWTMMERSSRKRCLPLQKTDAVDNIFIPLDIFTHRDRSILETLIHYLRSELSLTNHQIARLLDRSDKTVWAVCSRFQEGGGKQ